MVLLQAASSTSGVLGFASGLVAPIIRIALDVFGMIWWFSLAWVAYHVIMSKVHPTPSGRGSHIHEAFERSKAIVTGIITIYLALYIIASIINYLGGNISYAALGYAFFIRPVTDLFHALLGV